jgi:hypothetical protein
VAAHREQRASLPPGSYLVDLDIAEKLLVGPGLPLRCRICGHQAILSADPHKRKSDCAALLEHWRLHSPEKVDKFLDFARCHPVAVLEPLATLLVEENGPELIRGGAITRIRGEG